MPELDEYTMERVLEEFEQRCYDNMNHAIETEEGLGIEYDEDVVCDVCQSPDGEDGNEMVFCDKCNICVHQVRGPGGPGEATWGPRRPHPLRPRAAPRLAPATFAVLLAAFTSRTGSCETLLLPSCDVLTPVGVRLTHTSARFQQLESRY